MNRRYLSTLALAFATSVIAFAAQAAEVKNIVIVHGAFADGSGWRKATEILEKRGFNVTIVQEPITSLADDVAATNRVLDLQDGPTLLVGHSYGGMVITEAGQQPECRRPRLCRRLPAGQGRKSAQPCELKAGRRHEHPRDEGRKVSLSRSRSLRERLRRRSAKGRGGVPGEVAGLRLQGSIFRQGRRSRLEDEKELGDRRHRGSLHQSRPRAGTWRSAPAAP